MTEIERRTLAPAEGRHVRHPDGRPLSAKGESVVFDTYWRRRLDDGDVVEAGVDTGKAKGDAK